MISLDSFNYYATKFIPWIERPCEKQNYDTMNLAYHMALILPIIISLLEYTQAISHYEND